MTDILNPQRCHLNHFFISPDFFKKQISFKPQMEIIENTIHFITTRSVPVLITLILIAIVILLSFGKFVIRPIYEKDASVINKSVTTNNKAVDEEAANTGEVTDIKSAIKYLSSFKTRCADLISILSKTLDPEEGSKLLIEMDSEGYTEIGPALNFISAENNPNHKKDTEDIIKALEKSINDEKSL